MPFFVALVSFAVVFGLVFSALTRRNAR